MSEANHPLLDQPMKKNGLTINQIDSMKSESIGGASVSMAIILLITQLKPDSLALQVSLLAAAIGLPLWICTWQIMSIYCSNGEISLKYLNTIRAMWLPATLWLFGILALFISLVALIWYMSKLASILFVLSSVCMAVVSVRHTLYINSKLQEADHKIDVREAKK